MINNDKLDIILYNIFNNDYSDEVKKVQLQKLINNINVDFDDLKNTYEWLKTMDIDPNIYHLEENHKLIYEIFDEYNKMLNVNNIEYYYTSGILSYLLVDKNLERYHHDLDIFINMRDLEKLEKICFDYNFSFERKIGERDDGTKRVMLKMYYKNIVDIPITVFMYTKEKDSSIIQKDYFIDERGNQYVEYIYNSPQISKLSFSDVPHYHNEIEYYAITLEALFLCKKCNRAKDVYDCTIFSSAIDIEKLHALECAFKINLPNTIVTAQEDAFNEFIFNKIRNEKKLIL